MMNQKRKAKEGKSQSLKIVREKKRARTKKEILIFHIVIIEFLLLPLLALGQPLFIYRPNNDKISLLDSGLIDPRGEIFALLLMPSNFPSFNDLSGIAGTLAFKCI